MKTRLHLPLSSAKRSGRITLATVMLLGCIPGLSRAEEEAPEISDQVAASPAGAVKDEVPPPLSELSAALMNGGKFPPSIGPSIAELGCFGEPVLKSTADESARDVRFIYIGSFRQPVSIRLSRRDNKTTLTTVQMEGKGGYDWKKIRAAKTIEIDDAEWKKLEALWNVKGARKPSLEVKQHYRVNMIHMMMVLDGGTWFLEVNDGRAYTVEGVENPRLDVADSASATAEYLGIEGPLPPGVPQPIGGDEAKELNTEMGMDLKPFIEVCLHLYKLSGLKGDVQLEGKPSE